MEPIPYIRVSLFIERMAATVMTELGRVCLLGNMGLRTTQRRDGSCLKAGSKQQGYIDWDHLSQPLSKAMADEDIRRKSGGTMVVSELNDRSSQNTSN